MTAFEYLELAHNGWSTAMATVSLSIAVLSGYIVIVYMVGAKLSTIQVTVLNTGYATWSAFLLISAFALISGAHKNANIAISMQPDMGRVAANPYAPQIVLAIGSYLILASLWFMWSVRHPKNEAP